MVARIVVIDNYETIRQLLTFNLQIRGYQVFSYDYASIDLAALKQLHADLIILDFNSGDGGTGWEFLQILKMEDTTANIPILISTTTVHLSAEIRGYLLTRYIRVVYKPFDLAPFLRLVQRTLTLASQAGGIVSSDRSLPILVVEDTEHLREALVTVLRLEGYQVVTADNGLLALDAVYNAEHCLILLDAVMPIMDGFEFLRIYDRQLRPHTPVIILSGEAGILTRVLPSFVVDVLSKPFEVSHLVRLAEKYTLPV